MAEAVSVVSAAVVSGELILGLSSGQLIRAGFVQGQQGPAGIPGPKGDTGRPGRDGNTILSGPGAPRPDDGVAGDWYIDTTRSWLWGPKTGTSWPGPVKLKPDAAQFKLPNGFKAEQGDAIYPRVFAGAMAGGGGAGTVVIGGTAVTSTGQTIIPHGKPLPAGAPVTTTPPGGGAPTITPAVWTTVAIDADGHALIADIYAESGLGSVLVEIAALMGPGGTGYSQVYEVKTGAAPNLTFQTIVDSNGKLTLQMYSDVALSLVEGRVMYI